MPDTHCTVRKLCAVLAMDGGGRLEWWPPLREHPWFTAPTVLPYLFRDGTRPFRRGPGFSAMAHSRRLQRKHIAHHAEALDVDAPESTCPARPRRGARRHAARGAPPGRRHGGRNVPGVRDGHTGDVH